MSLIQITSRQDSFSLYTQAIESFHEQPSKAFWGRYPFPCSGSCTCVWGHRGQTVGWSMRSARWHHYSRRMALASVLSYQVGLDRDILAFTAQAAIYSKPQRSRSVSSIHGADTGNFRRMRELSFLVTLLVIAPVRKIGYLELSVALTQHHYWPLN